MTADIPDQILSAIETIDSLGAWTLALIIPMPAAWDMRSKRGAGIWGGGWRVSAREQAGR